MRLPDGRNGATRQAVHGSAPCLRTDVTARWLGTAADSPCLDDVSPGDGGRRSQSKRNVSRSSSCSARSRRRARALALVPSTLLIAAYASLSYDSDNVLWRALIETEWSWSSPFCRSARWRPSHRTSACRPHRSWTTRGAIVDGGSRDRAELKDPSFADFPVFARYFNIVVSEWLGADWPPSAASLSSGGLGRRLNCK